MVKYSLFGKRRNDKKWTRLSESSFTLQAARRVWKTRLLAPYLATAIDNYAEFTIRELRVVK